MFSSSARSVFSSNAATGTSSAFGSSNSKNDGLVKLYAKLGKYINSIELIYIEYTKGNFGTVATILTQDTYNRYAVRLSNLARPKNKYREYEYLRENAVNSLHGMFQSIQQYNEIIDLENELAISRQAEEILYDPQKLQRYISQLNRETSAFPSSNVTAIAATLKPEYHEYVQQYGYPEGGVFDMDKLAVILKKLQIVIL
mgnify:FL=1|jgi:hypothetical protein